MAKTRNAVKQAAFKARMAEAGFVQLQLWVPAETTADMQQAADSLRMHDGLTVARLVDVRTGRLCGIAGPRHAVKGAAA